MKVTFEKNILCEAVAPLMGGVSNKNTIPAIEGILITTVNDTTCNLSSFDLEKGFNIKVKATVSEAGSYIINGAKFYHIIRSLPEDFINFTVDGRCVCKIQCGKSEFELAVLPGEDFPTIPDFKSEINFQVPQGCLKNMIAKSLFAVAQNESRVILNGSFFSVEEGLLKVVSCDGNRLAIREQECEVINGSDIALNIKFILPGRTLGELLKHLKDGEEKVNISVSRKNAVFGLDNLIFFTRLIEGDYLDYRQFIPAESRISVEIVVENLIASLDRAALVSEDKSLGQTKSYVKCSFYEDILKISSSSPGGKVYDEIPAEKNGENIEIGFNCKYLLDSLRACGVEKVRFELNSPLSCLIIRPVSEDEKENFLYLVLPVRMRE